MGIGPATSNVWKQFSVIRLDSAPSLSDLDLTMLRERRLDASIQQPWLWDRCQPASDPVRKIPPDIRKMACLMLRKGASPCCTLATAHAAGISLRCFFAYGGPVTGMTDQWGHFLLSKLKHEALSTHSRLRFKTAAKARN
ncbi:hypothetical protein EG329_004498 [Mollisiaceae sp. DMI_Dod_QoI]|nr:hypothetical protein EG329_004498 [Helotiales sp. DMI_Dod_QoI]